MKNSITNKRRLVGLFFYLGIVVLLHGCKEYGGPVKPDNLGAAPKLVSNVRHQAIPGGAQIFYSVPKDKNLKYIKAVFSTNAGGQQTVKASKYKDSLTVEGFADTTAREVKLYSTSENGVSSKPVTVRIHPLEPPFKKVYRNVKLNSAPGGVELIFNGNDTKANLSLVVVQDTINEILPVTTFYSSSKTDTSVISGLQNGRYKLGYYIRDTFQNRSDTTYESILPLTLYNRSDWTIYDVDSQQATSAFGLPPFPASKIIDGDESSRSMWATEFSPSLTSLPHYVSIDMNTLHTIHGLQIVGSREYDYQNPAEIAIEVSKDGKNWSNSETFKTEFEVGGKLRNNFYLKDPKKGQYFKVIILKNTQLPAPSNFSEVYAF